MVHSFPILSSITYVPLLGALVIFFWTKASAQAARWIALVASIVSFILSVIMMVGFDRHTPGMQFNEVVNWLPGVGVSYRMGIDGISLLLVVLTTLLMVISILASWQPVENRVREYMITMLLLETGMLGVFVSLDLFLFYIFWEVMLIPMALLIGIWGSANRVYAAVKFFLYTLAGSLLMLVGIVATYQAYFNETGVHTLDVQQLATGHYSNTLQIFAFLSFFLAFAIKVPLWPFHTWLPDAHVEAPTAGSVILAGVLLKMGGYGMLRFNLPLYPYATQKLAPYIIALSVIAIIYGALVALVQPDLKKLVAYSSVSHMGFVTLGIFALNAQGLYGAMIVMVSHGFLTSGLFLIVGQIYYRGHTRLIASFGGLARNMPVYASFFMIFMLGSLGLPGLSGFPGEFLAMLGSFRVYRIAGVIAAAVVIFAAWYLMWMYQRVAWGTAPGEPMELAGAHGHGGGDDAGHGHGHTPAPVMGGSEPLHASTTDERTIHEAQGHGQGHDFVPPQTFRDLNWVEILTLAPLAILTFVVGIYPNSVMAFLGPTLQLLLKPFGGHGF